MDQYDEILNCVATLASDHARAWRIIEEAGLTDKYKSPIDGDKCFEYVVKMMDKMIGGDCE